MLSRTPPFATETQFRSARTSPIRFLTTLPAKAARDERGAAAAGILRRDPQAEASAPPDPPPENTGWVERRFLDIPYASVSPAQKLDLFLPNAGSTPCPLVVFVHGGGFIEGDKADWQRNSALSGLRRGYAVASVGYRLSGEARFPAAVRDVAAAIRFLRSEAAGHGIDGTRMALWGNSAGGNIAALVAVGAPTRVFDDPSLGHAEQSSGVAAVIDWYAPIDFLSMDPQFRASGRGRATHGARHSHESRYLGGMVSEVPEQVRACDPTSYLGAHTPPFLIQHGDADEIVPVEQSIAFAARLCAAGVPVALDVLPGVRHAAPAFEAAANRDRIFAFLDQHLKP